MPEIPSELIQQIVECLWDDHRTLRAASSVASSFRALCQEALFSEIVLSYPSAGACQRLLEILQQSPTILSYIKGISVLARYQPRDLMVLPEEMCNVLSFIPLQGIQQYTCHMSQASWSFASNAIKAAVLGPSRGPSLRSLRLCCVSFPLELRSPFLKHISLLICRRPETDGMPLPKIISSSVQLETLEVSQDRTHVNFLSEGFWCTNFSHLTSLAFRNSSRGRHLDQTLDVRNLLANCASSLELFTYNPDYGIHLESHLPYIAQLGALRKLVICQRDNFWESPIILESLPSPNVVKTIQVEVLFTDPEPVNVKEEDAFLWNELDRILSDKQHFPELQHVLVMCSSMYTFEESERQGWIEALQKGLPKLTGMGILGATSIGDVMIMNY